MKFANVSVMQIFNMKYFQCIIHVLRTCIMNAQKVIAIMQYALKIWKQCFMKLLLQYLTKFW